MDIWLRFIKVQERQVNLTHCMLRHHEHDCETNMPVLKSNRNGTIFRAGNTVLRPVNFWTESVHTLLHHLEAAGISGTPKVISLDADCERLSYIEGETTDLPLTGTYVQDKTLVSAAKLLREMHDSTAQFVANVDVNVMQWMLPSVDLGCFWERDNLHSLE